MSRLKGKTALVTGAGQGIGAEIARELAREGADVWITDVNADAAQCLAEEVKADDGSATALALDVCDEDAWRGIAAKISALDILVHNAGVELVSPFADLELESWRRVQAINVEGAFLGTKAMLGALAQSGRDREAGASVILMSSAMGIVAVPDQCAYNTSKGALRQMAKALAIEFAKTDMNIRVNSVHPGLVETPMADGIIDEWIRQGLAQTDNPAEIKAGMAAMHPRGRLGRPQDIAFGVVYLASDEAGFVTGSELVIDGGWTAQ